MSQITSAGRPNIVLPDLHRSGSYDDLTGTHKGDEDQKYLIKPAEALARHTGMLAEVDIHHTLNSTDTIEPIKPYNEEQVTLDVQNRKHNKIGGSVIVEQDVSSINKTINLNWSPKSAQQENKPTPKPTIILPPIRQSSSHDEISSEASVPVSLQSSRAYIRQGSSSWSIKKDEELKLDMKQEEVISRIDQVSQSDNKRSNENKFALTSKLLGKFKRRAVVSTLPIRSTKTYTTNSYVRQNQSEAREIKFDFKKPRPANTSLIVNEKESPSERSTTSGQEFASNIYIKQSQMEARNMVFEFNKPRPANKSLIMKLKKDRGIVSISPSPINTIRTKTYVTNHQSLTSPTSTTTEYPPLNIQNAKQNQMDARDIIFNFNKPRSAYKGMVSQTDETSDAPTTIVPELARQFKEEAKLIRTDTGELAYELSKSEGNLLLNCDKHTYIRRSYTEPRSLNLKTHERTEFGSVIRRSNTIGLINEHDANSCQREKFDEYVKYLNLCKLEKKCRQKTFKIERQTSKINNIQLDVPERCEAVTPPALSPTMSYLPVISVRVATTDMFVENTDISPHYTRDLTPLPSTPPSPAIQIEDIITEQSIPIVASIPSKTPLTSADKSVEYDILKYRSCSSLWTSTPSELSNFRGGSSLTLTRSSPLSNYTKRRKDLIPAANSPYTNASLLEVAQKVQESVDGSATRGRIEDYIAYRRTFEKVRQRRALAELNHNSKKKHILAKSIYLSGKTPIPDAMQPSPPSPISNESLSTSSPDTDELEEDTGLCRILNEIKNITNANICEIKSYKSPPSEVHDVIKCVFMCLGEDLKTLQYWQECVILLSKLGRKHVRRRVLRMRKNKITNEIRENAKEILSGWTSYDIAIKSRVCVLFFLWCKEICDLNKNPEDNPLLPVIMGKFNRRRHNNVTRIPATISSGQPIMLNNAVNAFKSLRKTRLQSSSEKVAG